MIEYRLPRAGEENQLRRIWKEAFRESDSFIDLFMARGYAPERCLTAVKDERITGMLYWFHCTLEGGPVAYLYGIATDPAYEGRGVASGLIRAAHDHLWQLGYAGVILVPGSPSLFRFYERLGYRRIGTIDEFSVSAGRAIPVRELSPREYELARRTYLPENGVCQDRTALEFFHGFARFYQGEDFLAAVSREEPMCYEFLGSRGRIGGLLASLNHSEAVIRAPGTGRDFAMAHWFGNGPESIHLGLAFD